MFTYILIVVLSVLFFFFFILIGKKFGLSALLEKLAILWFRLACSFAILYIAHIIVDGYNFIVPVNLFSALTITILGIPGMVCIAIITVLQ